MRRIHQRDLRRGSAVRAARVRRAGLERRRSAPRAAEDRLDLCHAQRRRGRRSAAAARMERLARRGVRGACDAGGRACQGGAGAHAHLPGDGRIGRGARARVGAPAAPGRRRVPTFRPSETGWRWSRPPTAAMRASSRRCRAAAGSPGAPPAIRPKNRSSPRTSIRCFSSAASTATSIRGGSNATFSSRGRAARRPWSSSTRRTWLTIRNRWPTASGDCRGRSGPRVSCRVPDSVAILRQYLGVGQTGALLGSSGVGKSTIVNQLIGHELLRTQRRPRVGQPRPPHEHGASARAAAWSLAC